MFLRAYVLSALAFWALPFAPMSWAQDAQAVRVEVSDPQGLPIMGARVAAIAESRADCTTNSVGVCELPQGTRPPIEVTASGYTPQRVAALVNPLEARVTMRIKTRVTVDVNSSSLNFPGSVQGTTVSGEEVENVPVWLRKLENIQPLFPGTVPRATDDEWGEGLAAAGSRSTMMNSLLDGMPNRAERRGGMAIRPPLEAVAEFKVLSSGYSAEYGQTSGAQVLMTTRSGSDHIHGDIYNYARDRFGCVLGGPIRKGKTYYFGSYERANTNFDSPVTSNVLRPDQVSETGAVTSLSRTLLPLVATSASGSIKYEGEHSLEEQILARVDHSLSDRSRLMLRAARGVGNQVLEPDAINLIARDWPSLNDDSDSFLLSFSHDRTTKQLTIRASYLDSIGGSLSRCHNDSRFSVVLGQSPPTRGCPIVQIAGYQRFGDSPYAYKYRSRTAVLDAAGAFVFGRDSVKAGIGLNRLRYLGSAPVEENGFLYFDGSRSGSAVTDFLLGQPAVAIRDSATANRRGELQRTGINLFLQNSLRLGESLVIDAGLRVDHLPSLAERSGQLSSFDPSVGVLLSGADANLLRSQGWVIDPRLGFSLRPFGGKTIIRGGIGQYSGNDILSVILGQLTSAPGPRTFVTSAPLNPLNVSSGPVWTPIDTSIVRGIDARNRIPRLYQYSLTIEREIGSSFSVEVGYVGSRGLHLGRLVNINTPLPTGALNSIGEPVLSRAYLNFSDVIFDDQGAFSSYHAGQIRLGRHAWQGVDLSLGYTYSKSIDDSSSTQNTNWTGLPYAQNPRNLTAERAVSDFDHRHQLTGFVVVSLDRFTKSAVFRRSELSTAMNMMSGLPFSPVTDAQYLYRADMVSDPNQNVPSGFFFNPAAFRPHAPTAADPTYFGNAGRNSLRTPYFNTIDLAFNKGFRIKSRAEIKIRIEAFNLLDRRVPYIYNVMGDPNFGKRRHYINEERHIVAGARVSF